MSGAVFSININMCFKVVFIQSFCSLLVTYFIDQVAPSFLSWNRRSVTPVHHGQAGHRPQHEVGHGLRD